MMTRVQFEEELRRLGDQVLRMGSEADRMLDLALQALTQQSVELAEQVIAGDDAIDDLDIQIEMEAMRIIALQQPVARDLRLVGTALKVISDIERIGDHAVDIAKVARKLARDTFFKPLADIPYMAERVRGMLRDALTAFVTHDLDLVRSVVAADDEIDDLFHKLRDELHAAMSRDAKLVVQASYLLFVAYYLERVADHIVNIAERVYYVETGKLEQLARTHKSQS
ncbi:MAG: phosphate signaling complex protein PhoU [Chthonomonadales bacterium]